MFVCWVFYITFMGTSVVTIECFNVEFAYSNEMLVKEFENGWASVDCVGHLRVSIL